MDTDFIQLIQRRNEKSDEWWGYSQEQGWVVLNRRLYTNEGGKGKNEKYIFLRCSDWMEYEDLASNWTAPNYVYGVPYLKQLQGEKLNQTNEELFEIFSYYRDNKKQIKEEQLKRQEELKFQRLQQIHNQYLESKGLQKQEIVKNKNRHRRVSHCWSCLLTVDNNTDFECKGCGWIVCKGCGACEKPFCSNNAKKFSE